MSRFKNYVTEVIEQDTFYNVEHISNKIKFLKDAISKSYEVKVDELDASISWARKRSKAKPNDVFKIVNDKNSSSQYRFVVRKTVYGNDKPYIQALVRTNISGDKDYFLWINIKLEKLDYFIKKYRLKEGF